MTANSRRRVVPPPVTDDNPATAPEEGEPAGKAPPVAEGTVATKDPGPLATVLNSGGGSEQDFAAALLALRRKQVDPMNDYVLPGTRVLAWVQEAIQTQAAWTGRSQQEILRDALLGTVPILPALLDAAYKDRYGRPRHE